MRDGVRVVQRTHASPRLQESGDETHRTSDRLTSVTGAPLPSQPPVPYPDPLHSSTDPEVRPSVDRPVGRGRTSPGRSKRERRETLDPGVEDGRGGRQVSRELVMDWNCRTVVGNAQSP